MKHNLGAYEIDNESGLTVLCRACAKRMSRNSEMPGAELVERGGWLEDEHCDKCGDAD